MLTLYFKTESSRQNVSDYLSPCTPQISYSSQKEQAMSFFPFVESSYLIIHQQSKCVQRIACTRRIPEAERVRQSCLTYSVYIFNQRAKHLTFKTPGFITSPQSSLILQCVF